MCIYLYMCVCFLFLLMNRQIQKYSYNATNTYKKKPFNTECFYENQDVWPFGSAIIFTEYNYKKVSFLSVGHHTLHKLWYIALQ